MDGAERRGRSWTLTLWGGILAILVGLILLFAPVTTLLAAAIVFGAFALIDGLIAIVTGFRTHPGESRWPHFVYGGIGVLVGLLVLAWPGLSVAFLAVLIGLWAIALGVMGLVVTAALPREARHWTQWVGAAAAIVLGGYLLFTPAALLVLVAVVGIYAIIRGILLIVAALRLRRVQHQERGRGEVGPSDERRAA